MELEELLQQLCLMDSGNSHSIPVNILLTQFYLNLNQDRNHGSHGIDGFLQRLNNKRNNIDRVNYVYDKLKKYKMLTNTFERDNKDDLKALKFKERGNQFFGEGDFNMALKLYTVTLMKAANKEIIAIAFANRSAALFKLKLYKECITDIDRALANNYPDNLKPKLVLRKVEATALLHRSRVPRFRYYEEPPQIPADEKNSSHLGASNCVEVTNDASHSRVIATRDIQIGEVIAVETPFTAVSGAAFFYHCDVCFTLCYNPIPCKICTQFLFCGEACMQIALSSYHKYECPIMYSIRKLVEDNGRLILAVRMALKATNELADEVLKLDDILDKKKDSTDNKVKISMITAIVYDLVKKHTNRLDEANHATFKDILMKFLRVCSLTAVGVREMTPPVDDDDNDLLYNYYHFYDDEEGYDEEKSFQNVGWSVYPFYSRFRHGCCPNVSIHHHGMTRVLRPLRTIKKGEECFVSFGPHYTTKQKENRQNRLFLRYRFKCACRACKEDWPQLEYHLPLSEENFLLPIEKFKIAHVRSIIQEKIDKIKHLEITEPSSDLMIQQKKLKHYYNLLGNKRLIH